MSLPRPIVVLATVAVISVLAGCSSDDGDNGGDADAAHTAACRTYVLGVAGQDKQASELLTEAARVSSWNPDTISASLDAVSEAAKDAGLVDGLSDDDFEVYGALVEAAGTAYARTNTDGGPGISKETAEVFQAAAQAVRSECDAG